MFNTPYDQYWSIQVRWSIGNFKWLFYGLERIYTYIGFQLWWTDIIDYVFNILKFQKEINCFLPMFFLLHFETITVMTLWLTVVRPIRVYLLDFFCSGIQFYILLSPYLCFISFLYLDLYVF